MRRWHLAASWVAVLASVPLAALLLPVRAQDPPEDPPEIEAVWVADWTFEHRDDPDRDEIVLEVHCWGERDRYYSVDLFGMKDGDWKFQESKFFDGTANDDPAVPDVVLYLTLRPGYYTYIPHDPYWYDWMVEQKRLGYFLVSSDTDLLPHE